MFPIRDHNPSGRMPYVTLTLIALNVLAFIFSYVLRDDYGAAEVWYVWGIIPEQIMAGQGWATLITHMFLHGGWMHIIGNLLFLWIFGDNLEDQMGHATFLAFYLASGLAAAALQVAMDPASPVPMVGASGAIAGVMGGYFLLFPRAKVDVLLIIVIFFRIFLLPAWVVLGVWIGSQLFFGLATPSEEGGVAYWAHIGGFIAGMVLLLPLWLKRGARRFWARTEGHPPHAIATYPLAKSHIPRVGRRR